jgi:hypothetical protein
MTNSNTAVTLTRKDIFRTWWPLAASWVLMAVELPAVSAAMGHMLDPQISLAAWGGIVFPLSLLIEAPVIMLLAASTALSKDYDTYQRVRRYMMWMGGTLTALHVLVAFTPLYEIVVVGIMKSPPEIIEPARIGLQLMTPWTWSIAYRRFNQGVLIRFGYSRAVSVGTAVRLAADLTVLLLGVWVGSITGATVAGAAVGLGVISEAVYTGLRVRPVIAGQLRQEPAPDNPLTLRRFLAFYVPLALTSLIVLIYLPIGSAAMGRMPRALDSLAVWPVVSGLVFIFRSLGVAFNEVVVALLDEPGAVPQLRRFAWMLVFSVTTLLTLIAATPLSGLWLEKVSALPQDLAELGQLALWIALPVPALNALQSWFQGILVNSERTRGVTEAVVISLTISLVGLYLGIRANDIEGLYVAWGAFMLGSVGQAAWLWLRSRPVLAAKTSV